MDNQEWRTWLNESRAKQAQLQKQNYAMPSQGWSDPQALGPMRGNSGEGWGTEYTQGPVVTERFPGQVNQHAPGYRPGIGSMTPEAQAAADRAWEEKQRMWDAEEAYRNKLEEESYAKSRLREGVGSPATRDWQRYEDVMAQPYVRPEAPQGWRPVQGPTEPAMGIERSWANIKQNLGNFIKPFYDAAGPQMGTWDQLQTLLSGQRPNQGLR